MAGKQSAKLAIIHTTPATIEPLKQLAAELMPGVAVVNFVDDTVLPELASNGGDVGAVKERLCAYAMFAAQQGADCILSACSSVGEVVGELRVAAGVPVVRIDEAMAEQAVSGSERVGVAATLNTTLQPTLKLLARKAEEAGRAVEIVPALVEGAFELLMAGDKEGHDAAIASVVFELAASVDMVVLAQASMARAAAGLPEHVRSKLVTSPRLGMERVKRVMERLRDVGGR